LRINKGLSLIAKDLLHDGMEMFLEDLVLDLFENGVPISQFSITVL